MDSLIGPILTIDQFTVILVALLAGCGGYLMEHMISSRWLTMTFIPGFFLGGLTAIALVREFNIVLVDDKDSNLLVASAGGMMAALVIMLLISRFAMQIIEPRPRRTK